MTDDRAWTANPFPLARPSSFAPHPEARRCRARPANGEVTMFPATHGSDGPTYATLLRRSVHADCEPSRHVRPLLRHTDERSSRPPAPEGTHLLVVIDHRVARVYKSQLHGSVTERLIPY